MTERPEQETPKEEAFKVFKFLNEPGDSSPLAQLVSTWATTTAIWIEERVIGAFKRAPNTFLAWLRLNISGPLDESLEARISNEVSPNE